MCSKAPSQKKFNHVCVRAGCGGKKLIRSEYTMKDRKDETLKGVHSKELVETAITRHFPTFIMSWFFFFYCQLAKLSLCFTNCPPICIGALHMSPASCYSISKLLSSKSLGATYGKMVRRLFSIDTSNPYYFFWVFFPFFMILCLIIHIETVLFPSQSSENVNLWWLYWGYGIAASDSATSLHPARWSPKTLKQCESQGGA